MTEKTIEQFLTDTIVISQKAAEEANKKMSELETKSKEFDSKFDEIKKDLESKFEAKSKEIEVKSKENDELKKQIEEQGIFLTEIKKKLETKNSTYIGGSDQAFSDLENSITKQKDALNKGRDIKLELDEGFLDSNGRYISIEQKEAQKSMLETKSLDKVHFGMNNQQLGYALKPNDFIGVVETTAIETNPLTNLVSVITGNKILTGWSYLRNDAEANRDRVNLKDIIEGSTHAQASQFIIDKADLKLGHYESRVQMTVQAYDSINTGESYLSINNILVNLEAKVRYQEGLDLMLGSGKNNKPKGIFARASELDSQIKKFDTSANDIKISDIMKAVYELKTLYRANGSCVIAVPRVVASHIFAGTEAFGSDGQYRVSLFPNGASIAFGGNTYRIIEVADVFFDAEGTKLWNGTQFVSDKPAFLICDPTRLYRLARNSRPVVEGAKDVDIAMNGDANNKVTVKEYVRRDSIGGELLIEEAGCVGFIG